MTQRFGRKKRRAARASIAAAEMRADAADQARASMSRENAALYRSRDALSAEIDELCYSLIDILGPETALLPLRKARPVGLGDIYQWPIRLDRMPARLVPKAIDMTELDTRHATVNLVHLVAEVDRHLNRAAALVRIKDVSGRHSPVALYLSEQEFLRNGPGRDGLRYFMDFVEKRFREIYQL